MTLQAAILSFAAVAILLTVIPGMDTAIVLRSAISQGKGPAYATAIGVNCGALLWGIAAAVGASAVLAASHTAYTALKLVGAAYMIWLGLSMLWSSRRTVLLAMIHNLIALVWFSATIFAAQAARRVVTGARFTQIVDRLTGTVLVVFGARLVAGSRSF